jgi:hypothetical protein
MRRALFGVVVSSALAIFSVACGGDDEVARATRTKPPGGDVPGATSDPSAAQTPAESACSAAPAATQLSDAKDARDIRVAGKAVFFRTGNAVMRVLKDGTGKKEVFNSPDLNRVYVDKDALITIESTDADPNATIRVIKATNGAAAGEGTPALPGGADKNPPAGGGANPAPTATTAEFPEFPAPEAKQGEENPFAKLGTTTATNFNAAGTHVFASDDTSFFIVADTANGPTILQVSKDNPATQTTIVTLTDKVIDSPQLASAAIWYVRDNNRVFKVALADKENGVEQGEPTEVFGISYASCSLAVGEKAAYCSVGTALERRDLTGANPQTVLDAQKSKSQAPFGKAMNEGGSIFVRSAEPDPKVKHVIRVVSATADEKLLACGRNLVTDLAVDATHAVWTEEATGVFIAPR